MNNKKKMVLGAAFIVAIMALAGVGYAAFSDTYKGTTQSAANTYDVDYVIVAVGENGYSTLTNLYIVYDTSTVSAATPTTTYQWKGSTNVAHDVEVTIPADYGSTQDKDTFKLKAEMTFAGGSDYKVQYKMGTGSWTNFTGSDLATGNVEITQSGTTNLIWRIVPDEVESQENEPATPVTVTFTAETPAASVELPVITYTVTATQKGVSVSP